MIAHPITNYQSKGGQLLVQTPSGEYEKYRILGTYSLENKTNYTHPAPTIMGQTYSAPITSTVPHATAPTPVSYPRPPYPATYAAPPPSSSYSAPLLLETIPSPPIPASNEPAPYADPPATMTPSYAVPLLVANINISFPNNSSFKLTSSLHYH